MKYALNKLSSECPVIPETPDSALVKDVSKVETKGGENTIMTNQNPFAIEQVSLFQTLDSQRSSTVFNKTENL